MNPLSSLFIVGHVAASLLIMLMLMFVPSVHGCSCLVPDTAVERANDVRNSRTKLAVIARFTNETTYIDIDREHGPQEMETQNTTFIGRYYK